MAKETKPRLDLAGQSLEGIAEMFNEKYGENTLIVARHAQGLKVRFTSTGVYILDFATGGGIPKNRISEIRGEYSSGKTTLALMTIANFQKDHPEGLAAFVDVEQTVDLEYARRLGVDLNRCLVGVPDSGEQGVDIITELLGANDRDIFIVVDSIAALVPMAEVEASAEQQSMGLHARLINKLMRVATARMKRSMYSSAAASATILCLNQLREKIGVMFGNPETTPGGKGKDFAYGLALKVFSSPSDAVKEDITRNGVTRKVMFAKNIKFRVTKNKCGSSQYEEGEFMYYQKEYQGHAPLTFDNYETLFRFGLFYELIQMVPSKKSYLHVYGKISERKEKDFVARLREMPKTAKRLYDAILVKATAKEDVVIEEEAAI